MLQNPFLLGIAALVFAAPLVRGLFFPPEQLVAAGFVFLVAGLWAVDRYRRRRPVFRAWSLLELGAALLPLAYALSLLQAIHAQAALLGVVATAASYAIFLLSREAPLAGERGGVLRCATVCGGVAVAVVGLLAYVRWLTLPGSVTVPWKAAASAGRVGSTFQYHNTLAAYLGAAIMLSLGAQEPTGPWWQNAVWRGAAGLMAVVLALTQSRGGLAALLVGAAALVGLAPRGHRLQVLAEFGGVALGALLTLGPLIDAAGSHHPLLSLGWAAVAVLLSAAPWGAVPRPIRRMGPLARPLLGIGAVALLVLVMLYGGIAETPMANRVTTSAQAALDAAQNDTPPPSDQIERFYYVKDALRMFLDRPWLGGGAGAWAAQFRRYRSLPYYTTQVHSFYAQVAAETGVPGLLALGVFLVGFAVSAWRILRVRRGGSERMALAGGLAAMVLLFVHAAVDFDLSFLAVSFTLWALAGSLNGEVRRLHFDERLGNVEAAQRGMLLRPRGDRTVTTAVPSERVESPGRTALSWQLGFLLAGSVILLTVTAALLGGEAFKYWAGVRRDTGRLESAKRNYLRSLRFNPRDDATYLALADIYLRQAIELEATALLAAKELQDLREQAVRNLEHALNLNPQSPAVRAEAARAYLLAGRPLQALTEAMRVEADDPWARDGYEVAAQAEVQLGLKALETADRTAARRWFGQALQEGARVQARQEEFDRLPIHFGRSPRVAGRLALAVGQAHYFFRNTREAEKYLQLAGRDATVTPESEPWLAVLYRSTGPRGKDAWLQRRPWVRQAFQDENFLRLAALPQL